MCGIVGIMSTSPAGLTLEQYMAFMAAWAKAEDRGTHASGYIVSTGKQLYFGKSPNPSSENVQDLLKDMPFRPGIRFMLGHTRWATSGDPAHNINNHPLIVGRGKDLMGIHNGVISNKEELLKAEGWEAQRGVDTEIIFRLIHKYGVKSIKPFEKLRGLFNLAYVSRKNAGEFYLVRKGNPLVLKAGANFLAFGSMRHYWDALDGNLVPVEDNRVMTVTRSGIKGLKAFKPCNEWPRWERLREVRRPRGMEEAMEISMEERQRKYWERTHQEENMWFEMEDSEYIADPETGLIEKRGEIWPH